MDRTFKIDIPKPCAQRWDEMSQTESGKFCSHCSTVVIDFTQMTTTQLKAYFQNNTQPVCGRIDDFQLFQLNHPPIVHEQKARFSFQIAVAAVVALLVSTKASAQQAISKPQAASHFNSKSNTNAKTRENAANCTFLIKGVVKSLDDGLGLPGAHVKLLGTKLDTVTDTNGVFELRVQGAAQLEVSLSISAIGYSSHQLKVKLAEDPTDLTISLVPDSSVLGKVVITAPKPVTQHFITGGVVAVTFTAVKKPSFFKRVLKSIGEWF